WASLLRRTSGQSDVAVGTPIANRNREEIEPLIGCFINMLVLRSDLSGDPGFGELLGRVRESVLGAYAHQDLPFELLVQELQPERDLGASPLFQVALVFQNTPGGSLELRGLTLEMLAVSSGVSKFDLTITLFEAEGRLLGRIEHDRGLFDAATVRRMAGHLRLLLEGAVGSPEERIADLPLLSLEERRQLLAWSGGALLPVPDVCLHAWIEAQAARSPEAPAVEMEGERLSYRELDRRAGGLARTLRRLGVGSESLVGVCLERSLDLLVALLGVLKAGGAYVPLDPSYPQERLSYMLEDSGARVVVVADPPAAALPLSREGLHVIRVGQAWKEGEGAGSLASGAGPENLAYVIYTSGSTGRPKAALVPHRAIVHQIAWMQSAFGFGREDRILQKTASSFDVSVWELFAPLVAGGCVVLARPGEQQEPDRLAGTVRDRGITGLRGVPGLLEALLREPAFLEAGSLRWLGSGGEPMPPSLGARLLERFDARVVNLYGPTECAVVSTWWECRAG